MKILCTLIFACFSAFNIVAQDLIPKDWPHLKGYWKFQDAKNLTKPTVGNNLVLVGTHQQVAGAAYGDTAIRIAVGSYYKCFHNIAPNGGGDSVNRYTLMFDFKVLNFKRWHTFFQTDTTNANDGECFIRPVTTTKPARIGTATTKYTNDSINANQWYRLVISVNLDNFYRYYLNGKLVLEGDTQEVDDRFALLPQILFFADNDKEDDTIDIASVAIFDTCLSSKDIAKIGTIEPCIANPPKVNLGRDTTLCANNSISLDGGANMAKYQWSTGNKMPFQLIDANTLGLGKSNVWVKVTDFNGCIVSDSVIINYLPLPKADIGNDTALCKGQIVKLSAGTDMSQKYLWKIIPKGATISTSNTVSLDSSGVYMVVVTSALGCENTDTINIAINQNPAKPKINVTGNLSLCEGDSVRLEGPGSYSAYMWSNGVMKQSVYIKKSNGLTLKVTDKNGCSGLSDTVKVIVHSLPSTPVIQYTANTFCNGDSLILKVTPGYKQYIWQDGIGKAIRIIKDAAIYSVHVRDSNNCKSSVSAPVFITVLSSPPKPGITFSGKTTFCEGGTIKLSATVGYPAYIWTDSSKTKDVMISKSGNYRVTAISSNGCKSPWSDNVSITVNPSPLKPKVVLGSKDSLKSNTMASRYKWFRNSLLLADTTFSIYSLKSGFFQMQIAEKDCWSKLSDSLYFKNLNSETFINLKLKLHIIPNPVNTITLIKIENCSGGEKAIINVYNIHGQKIVDMDASFSDLCKGIFINMEEMKKGVYLVRVISKDGIYSGRLEKL